MEEAGNQGIDRGRAAIALPITFKVHPLAGRLGIIAGLLLVVLGAWMTYWGHSAAWYRVVLMLIGAAGACYAFLSLQPDRSRLRLTPEGFETAGVFRRKFVPWRNIEKFVYVRTDEVELVGWNYSEHSGSARSEAQRAAVSELADATLMMRYRGISQPDLVALLNEVLAQQRFGPLSAQNSKIARSPG